MPVRLLRTLSTVLLAFAIGQAGLGSGFAGSVLIGQPDALILQIHYINAFLTVGMVVACIVAALQYRRAGGPNWPLTFAGAILLVSIPQIILGTNGVGGAHIFLGALYLATVTTFCSYMWRHQPKAEFTATA